MGPRSWDSLQAPLLLIRRNRTRPVHGNRYMCILSVGPGPVPWLLHGRAMRLRQIGREPPSRSARPQPSLAIHQLAIREQLGLHVVRLVCLSAGTCASSARPRIPQRSCLSPSGDHDDPASPASAESGVDLLPLVGSPAKASSRLRRSLLDRLSTRRPRRRNATADRRRRGDELER